MIFRLFIILTIFLGLLSCSEYQRTIKSEDSAKKYELAERLYNEGKYKKSNRLWEQIVPIYRGKPQAERIMYFHADTYYHLKDYHLAGYQFERFYKSYPQSQKAEEASFLSAKSYYKVSPVFDLDKTETEKAIDKLQDFIDRYPLSDSVPSANRMMEELQRKLEKKYFEIAKQYNTIRNYKASIKSFDNFIFDFPGTPLREDAYYYRFDSSYYLAMGSVPSLKGERLQSAKTYYENLISNYPNTSYKEVADVMIADIENELPKYVVDSN